MLVFQQHSGICFGGIWWDFCLSDFEGTLKKKFSYLRINQNKMFFSRFTPDQGPVWINKATFNLLQLSSWQPSFLVHTYDHFVEEPVSEKLVRRLRGESSLFKQNKVRKKERKRWWVVLDIVTDCRMMRQSPFQGSPSLIWLKSIGSLAIGRKVLE